MNFYVGQKVVCVPSIGPYSRVASIKPPLIVGRIYMVRGIRLSPCCGEVEIDVGLHSPCSRTFCECGAYYDSSEWWLDHVRFRPLDELHDQLERIEKEGCPLEPETVEQ